MLSIAHFVALLVLAFAGLNSVVATPATESGNVYPEVVPGPGLPSLKELGLTSEQLYKMTPTLDDRGVSPRSAQLDGSCSPWSTGYIDYVVACYNYLQSVAGYLCVIPGGKFATITYCSAGDAKITLQNLADRTDNGSPCGNVAWGVQWSFTSCISNGRVGGFAPAYGNGDMAVGTVNINY
ncbi:hypothetical protein BDN72DRAFT_960370 [Pluteus cervinus]|uniref:Uncharacterized protein n=1 Tax=Pluteus cervinus TaxID=181527 RepID=A0ACD3AS18_9AGAR|nr:hypothetical protein BDN72DRAFT_960370 [Pluteus cervinus]